MRAKCEVIQLQHNREERMYWKRVNNKLKQCGGARVRGQKLWNSKKERVSNVEEQE